MRRPAWTRFAVLFLIGLTAPVPARAAEFPDKNLEAAVRASLHLDEKTELKDDALKNVYVLEAAGKGIENLAGLEGCTNLSLIKLSKNKITDLGPLKDLKNLQSLDVSGNQIEDLGPLAGLTGLQYLAASDNKITNLEALSKLEALSALELDGNQIEALGPLRPLKGLASLYLARNKIQDLAPLAEVDRLSTLNLSGNQVEDLAPLKGQKDLRLLILDHNKIQNLAAVVCWTSADAEGPKRIAPFLRLYLRENPLSDSAKNEQVSALKALGVKVEL